MKLSIVSTLYRSAPGLAEFHRRAMAAGEALAAEVEMVLVDDGSPDESLALALEIQARDPRVLVVELARNFGHHRAMMTGLAHATGELVFLIDSDLEEEPELLARFHETLESDGWDVVYGVQAARRGGWFERVSGQAFYGLVDLVSEHPLPRNLMTVRLMRRAYVDALVAHQDRAFVIAELWLATGFRQTSLEVRKLALSPTTYSVGRRLRMAIEHITTTSTRLLYLIFYMGLGISLLAALAMAWLLLRYLLHGVAADGWASLFVSVWFLGGVTVLILAVIGLYVANILVETKRRPYTVVRAVHRPRG
jgi:putative glycosyltransferase